MNEYSLPPTLMSRLPTIARTLLTGGYSIKKFERPAEKAFLISLMKRDQLGAEVRLVVLFTEALSTALESRLSSAAQRFYGTPMLVALTDPLIPRKIEISYSLAEFYEQLGGEVRTDRIFRADLERILQALGKNKLPSGIQGSPDDLLEDYSKECLRYLLDSPVRRFGQERRFESLPDGLALAKNGINIYFDAKAYGDRYHPSADDIKRFASYVQDFNERYARYVGKIWRFLVISGEFSKSKEAIDEKVWEFESLCDTQLTMLSAGDLAKAVRLVRTSNCRRGAINWKRVLISGVGSLARLEGEISRITKDNIIS